MLTVIFIQDIGMGIYQWELFVLCGFGWRKFHLLHNETCR